MSDIDNMSFEEAMMQLEAICSKLESGRSNLDDAIKDYELANQLRKHCEKKLQAAKLKVDQIVKNENGDITLVKYEEQ